MARLPLVEQEVLDRAAHVGPQRLAVVLEHDPLRAALQRSLQIGEVAAHVDVLPLRVGADGARAPEPVAAALEEAEAVDALRVEHVLLRLVEQELEADRHAHDLVGRRLVHALFHVVARVDAGHEAAGRQQQLVLGDRVDDLDPGVVHRAVGRVDLATEGAHAADRLVVGRVQHGDAIAHPLAVRDQVGLDAAPRAGCCRCYSPASSRAPPRC